MKVRSVDPTEAIADTLLLQSTKRTRLWAQFGMAVALAGFGISAAAAGSVDQLSIRMAAALVLATALAVYFLLSKQSVLGVWSSQSMAFLILAMFHAGLFVEIAISGQLSESFTFHQSWMVAPVAQEVMRIIIVAFLSFLFGASIPRAFNGRPIRIAPVGHRSEESSYRIAAARVGAVMVVGGVLFWFYENISAGGWAFFTLGYRAFFASSRDLDTSLTVLPILLGLGFVAQLIGLASSKLAISMFGVYAITSLAVGARIYPLSGIVILLVVLALGVAMPRARWLLVGVVGALALISIIRTFRNDGLTSFRFENVFLDPASSLAELGSTAKVVAVSNQWHDLSAEPYASGLTFWNPFVRGFNTVFGIPNTPASIDQGSFVNVISAREGQIGGSIIAEAHHNWGLLGVFLVLAAWGALMSIAASRSHSSLEMSVTALVLMLFLIQVRGFFGPVPALAVVGILLILVIRFIARTLRRAST